MGKSYDIAYMGILLGLSVALSSFENIIALPYGMRIGLSTIPVMFSLFTFKNIKQPFMLCFAKSLFVLVSRGVTAFAMSFGGGLLSFAVSVFMIKKTKSSAMLISMVGGMFHNIGQLIVLSVMLGTLSCMTIAPFLIITGIIAGTITGFIIKIILPLIIKLKKGGNS